MPRSGLLWIAPVVLLLASSGCKKAGKTYDSEIEVSRIDLVRTEAAEGAKADEKAGDLLDVEFTWTACGQREVIRGSAKFAECMKAKDNLKIGKKMPVKVEWHWDDAGMYDWDVTEMGGCARPYEDGDNASFDTVQECEAVKEHGAPVGFKCNRIPQKDLLAKCPWFARH